MTMTREKMTNSPEMNGSSFADLGIVMAMGFVSQAIDTMVTPAGVVTMMAQGAAKPTHSSVPASSPEPLKTAHAGSDGGAAQQTTSSKPKADYSVGYKNWSTVTATARKGTDDEVTFIFKRDGLWSWKLSAVNLPIDKFGSNWLPRSGPAPAPVRSRSTSSFGPSLRRTANPEHRTLKMQILLTISEISAPQVRSMRTRAMPNDTRVTDAECNPPAPAYIHPAFDRTDSPRSPPQTPPAPRTPPN